MPVDSADVKEPDVVASVARDHCLAPGRAEDPPGSGRYGRLFPELDPLRDGEAFFADQGRNAVEGRASAFVDDDAGAATDSAVPAGWPFFAQFVAHDLTADRSALVSRASVERFATRAWRD